MTTIKVSGMKCEKCVARISNALKAENIVFSVSLETKTVEVEDGKVKAAVEALDDLGFEAEA